MGYSIMIKIFNKEAEWTTKLNFVDENNVLVGYDYEQNCCEDFGWYISELEVDGRSINQSNEQDLVDYVFDSTFCNYIENLTEEVVFKLIAKDKPDLYLHLYNYHNGYYAHGFTFKIGENIIKEGYI